MANKTLRNKTLRETAYNKVKPLLDKYEKRRPSTFFHGALVEDFNKEDLLKIMDVLTVSIFEKADSENSKYVNSIFKT